MLAAVNRRDEKMPSGTIGCGLCISTRTKPASRIRPAPPRITVTGCVQPPDGPSVSA